MAVIETSVAVRVYPQRTSGLTRPVGTAKKHPKRCDRMMAASVRSPHRFVKWINLAFQ
jgi:hypothetical protein